MLVSQQVRAKGVSKPPYKPQMDRSQPRYLYPPAMGGGYYNTPGSRGSITPPILFMSVTYPSDVMLMDDVL